LSIPNLNLARRPFYNSRPIIRLAVFLWIVGGLLLVINAQRYYSFFTGSEDRADELQTLEARVDEHEERIDDLQDRLRDYRIASQNAQVTFLNQKIAARTFGWSELFDRLEDVLPNDVRISSLTPRRPDNKSNRRTRGRRIEDGQVRLALRGVAKTFEAELDLLDRLFKHPSFERPRLARDQRNKENQSEFDIAVFYSPGDPAPEAPVATANASGEGAGSEDGVELREVDVAGTRSPSIVSRGGQSGTMAAAPGSGGRGAPVVGSTGGDAGNGSADGGASGRTPASVLEQGSRGLSAQQQAEQAREGVQDLPRRSFDRQSQQEQAAGRGRPEGVRSRSSQSAAGQPGTGRSSTRSSSPGAAGFVVPVAGSSGSGSSGSGSSGAGGSGSAGPGRTPGTTNPFPRQPSASSALEPR
jgi:Tfp pilus assembly protein PilN